MKYQELLSKAGPSFPLYIDLVQPLKSDSACILLSYLIHLTEKSDLKSGWVKQSSEDLHTGAGLTYRKQRTARKKLKSLGLIEERYKRLDHEMYYRVVSEALRGFAIAAGIKIAVIQ